jgi:predicted nucleic acid-binding protein
MEVSEFVDTNVFIRYVTQDDPALAQRAAHVVEQLEAGIAMMTTSESVIVEVIQVLASKALYNLPRVDIERHLSFILSLSGLSVPHKDAHLRALELYAATNLDYVDALNIAHMERLKIETIVSFDRDFDRISGVKRREPT